MIKRLLTSVLLLASGCVTIGQHFNQHALDRASFELQCPREQLQVIGLNADLDRQVGPGNQVGVSGCSRRAVYVLTPYAGWVLNSESHPSASRQ